MPMNGMTSGWAYSGFSSDTGPTSTWEWDFAPVYTVAQVTLYRVAGGGLMSTGVISYRTRPDPNGADQIVTVGDPNNWSSWPSYAYAPSCTGVVFGTAVGTNQECYVLGNLFFW